MKEGVRFAFRLSRYLAIAVALLFASELKGSTASSGVFAGDALHTKQRIAEIPKESDWVDHGAVLSSGHPGTWDARLGGMISPATVVKKSGVYFLYYIGADGDRSIDGGPRHRALGVATSRDGLRFEKYSGNPVLTFLPNQNEEEGIFSAGGTLDADGNIVLYYGAMNAGSQTSTSVRSDVRVAVSEDGLHFAEAGVALSYGDSSVWGYGDELFPVGAFHTLGKWHVYYIAKSGARRRVWSHVTGNRPIYWDVGLAQGTNPEKLADTKPVLASGSYVIGGGDPVALGADKIALFVVRDFAKRDIEVRIAPTRQPERLTEPVQTYRFPGLSHATTFLDRDTNTWFMYFLDNPASAIKVRTAPVQN